eukprot:scaffold5065_cov134-Skeletonema_marinoi.AAC.6
MAMEPTDNDVLSGRGAWFNQHPGNEQFRRMLAERKAAYTAGTKKRKMDISKAIVEAIYSMDPPGRFLKQCPDTGQWNELSKRDAADKAAQAMAYAIKGESLKQKRRNRRYSQRSLSPQRHMYSHGSNNHQLLEGNDVSSSSVALHGLAAHGPAADTNNTESTLSNDHTDSSLADAMLLRVPAVPSTSNSRPQLQQSNSTTTTTLPTSSSIDQSESVNQNGLVQLLAQAVQQQQRHHHQRQQQQQQQQQQLPLQYTLGQNNPLGQQMIMMPPPQQQQLSPALLEGLTQILSQAQQQQQQQLLQQQQQQQLILLQRLMNQQTVNVLPSAASLPPPSNTPFLSLQGVMPMNGILPAAAGGASSTNNNYSTASQSQQQPVANNNQILQNLQQQQQQQQQLNPSNNNALLLSSVLSNLQHHPTSNTVTLSNTAPTQEAARQQLDILQRSLMMQQQQQQTLPLDPLHQAWLCQIQNSVNHQPINAQPSATVADMLTRQEPSEEEEERSVSEEKNPT